MIDLYVLLMQQQECVGVGAKNGLKYLIRSNQDLIYMIKQIILGINSERYDSES